jgi:hypothetical protein
VSQRGGKRAVARLTIARSGERADDEGSAMFIGSKILISSAPDRPAEYACPGLNGMSPRVV